MSGFTVNKSDEAHSGHWTINLLTQRVGLMYSAGELLVFQERGLGVYWQHMLWSSSNRDGLSLKASGFIDVVDVG